MGKRKVERGEPLDEAKGSLEYLQRVISDAFSALYGWKDELRDTGQLYFHIVETFADHLIVSNFDKPAAGLGPDEYYLVTYSQDEGGNYAFAAREAWEIVELAYQPQSRPVLTWESEAAIKDKKGTRLVERVHGAVSLAEAADGPRKIKGIGITAGVVNGNGRRYPAEVLRAAVDELKAHLHESAGQGRAMPLLGEAEHPSDKPSGRPNYLETVVRWTSVNFDGAQVLLEGSVLETSKGKDILALLEGGVLPGISQRGYGEAKTIKENGQTVEEITALTITGYDLVLEPSDPEARITILESVEEDKTMNVEELKKLISENKELFKGLVAEDLEAMGEAQIKKLEESIRSTLGIGPEDDLGKALNEAAEAKRTLAEQAQREAVEAAISESTKDLPYGKDLNLKFIEAVRAANPQAKDVKALVEAKRAEYDAIVAAARLGGMGYGVQVMGPVIEKETGTPAFARGAHEFTESLIRAGSIPRRDFRNPQNVNEAFAAKLLERFDKVYKNQLLREARYLDEAELSTDLNLPYSVSRAVLAAAFPQLVASSVFDFGVTDQAPSRVYYETYADETGVDVTVTDEAVVADLNVWVAMANKRVNVGTVVVTDHAGTTTYTEGSDYVIDYEEGKLMALATIADGQDLHVDYTYMAIRKGENAAIERGKMSLSYQTLEIVADRLATEITNEAVVFSRSQIGWDATTRTLNALINEIRRKIDGDLFYKALANALSVSSNSGGTWNSGASPIDYDELVRYLGVARGKILGRYYTPTAILMSNVVGDLLANWSGFTAAGSRADATLNANGFVGRVKGLPCFESTEMSDSYILVLNRELVQHRVFQPMALKGPYPSYSSNKLLANEQWYAEEYNGSICAIPGKGATVKIT